MSKGLVAVVSGGMDSVTALYDMAAITGDPANTIRIVSFNYGQRHVKELECARWHATALGMEHSIIDLTSATTLLTNSALVRGTEVPVPEGHYADESMQATIVPNRNMMMLSIAAAIAVNDGARYILAGMHAGDHPVYPDCRPEFVDSFNKTLRLANEGQTHPAFKLYTPFINRTKVDIVKVGAARGVPFEHTWSCYQGNELHCGLCGTCVERIEAFQLAGVDDPTVYSYESSEPKA